MNRDVDGLEQFLQQRAVGEDHGDEGGDDDDALCVRTSVMAVGELLDDVVEPLPVRGGC